MNSKTKIFIVMALIAVSLVFYLGESKEWEMADADSLKIGVLAPLTGGAASYGQNTLQGAELALAVFSSKHPTLKVELIVEDSRAEASHGVRAIQKMLNLDNVVAIVGDVTSGVTMAVAPLVNKAQVPIVSPGASSPNISEAGEYVFRTWPSDIYEAERMIRHIEVSNIKKLSIVRINNEYGLAMEQAIKKRLKDNVSIVAIEIFEQHAREMRTQLYKVKDAEAEAIYFIGFPEAAIIFADAYDAAGLNVPVFSTSAFEDPEIPQKTNGILNGTLYTKPIGVSVSTELFKSEYLKKFNVEPGVTSDTSYDAMTLILMAIRDIKSSNNKVTGRDIRQYLSQVKKHNGASGVLSFNEFGDVVMPIGIFVLNGDVYESFTE